MNCSRKTTIIAQGIYLWAKVQDQRAVPLLDEEKLNVLQWTGWSETWPMFVDFVKKQQFDLFDRVNAHEFPERVKEPRYNEVRVNYTDYDGRIVIEQYRCWNSVEPFWAVPAWDEMGHPDLEGPFDTLALAQAALAAEEI